MHSLVWITVGFIAVGLVILFSMKRSMERKLALIIESEQRVNHEEISNQPIIWWIWGAVIWGIISIFLIVWSFSVYM